MVEWRAENLSIDEAEWYCIGAACVSSLLMRFGGCQRP